MYKHNTKIRKGIWRKTTAKFFVCDRCAYEQKKIAQFKFEAGKVYKKGGNVFSAGKKRKRGTVHICLKTLTISASQFSAASWMFCNGLNQDKKDCRWNFIPCSKHWVDYEVKNKTWDGSTEVLRRWKEKAIMFQKQFVPFSSPSYRDKRGRGDKEELTGNKHLLSQLLRCCQEKY